MFHFLWCLVFLFYLGQSAEGKWVCLLKAQNMFDKMLKTNILTWYFPTSLLHKNYKSVKIWARLVKLQENIERKKTLMHVCLQMPDNKGFKSEVLIRLKNCSEKLTVSQKLCYFRGSHSHKVLYYQRLSIAQSQESFYASFE